MSDLTPPPDEPMPDQSRARIRAGLLEAAQTQPRARRWLVPAVVAASVVLVSVLAAWAVRLGPDDGSGASPAVAPTTSAAAPEPTPPDPTQTGPEDPDDPGDQWAGHGPCAQELRNPFPGAEQAAAFDEHTSFWVKGDRFALCDIRDRTTVQGPRPLQPVEQLETYEVSTVYTASGEVTRVAGGIVPDGVMAYDVAYTFPDGQTVRAETAEGGGHTWWRVVHAYESSGNELKQPPIEVTVSYSGVQEHYVLDWGLNTCAQVNHGC